MRVGAAQSQPSPIGLLLQHPSVSGRADSRCEDWQRESCSMASLIHAIDNRGEAGLYQRRRRLLSTHAVSTLTATARSVDWSRWRRRACKWTGKMRQASICAEPQLMQQPNRIEPKRRSPTASDRFGAALHVAAATGVHSTAAKVQAGHGHARTPRLRSG